jgi:hypothetical protein
MAKLVEVKEDSPLPIELQESTYHETSVKEIAELVDLNETKNIELGENTAQENDTEIKDNLSQEVLENNEEISNKTVEKKPTKNLDYQNLRLKQTELAKRLDIHYNTIGKRKSESDFPQWSQKRDPEGSLGNIYQK